MGRYSEEIANMKWSHSRVTSFEQCPYAFYLSYILKDKELYPPEGNFWANVGSFVHEILEKVLKGEMDIEEAPQYYVCNFDKEIENKIKNKDTMNKSFEACAEYLCEVDFEWLKDFEIVGVEYRGETEINGKPFMGYIDLLLRDRRDGKYVIVDHKSSEYPFKKNGEVKSTLAHKFQTYKNQMYLYSKFVYDMYGEYPKALWWNHFKDGGKLAKIDFVERDYKKAVVWFGRMIKKIEDEDDFAPKEDYFYCKNICNYRNSCETALVARKKMWQKK